ncbi:MAG: peptidyl-tRNA hydrolase Pth2 [Candidatus Woesearchaeota archaeon]
MYKQVIIVRQDLKLPKGKLAVQVAHASISAMEKSNKDKINKWKSEGMKKVVLKVKDLDELMYFFELASNYKIISALITDAGKTTVNPGTVTCLGLGPEREEILDKLTGQLKML